MTLTKQPLHDTLMKVWDNVIGKMNTYYMIVTIESLCVCQLKNIKKA